jgi:hypothetical protein
LKIQVNSDKNISTDARLIDFVRGEAQRALGRYKSRLTRVEFHLSDVNSHKFGRQDKRCLVEVRPADRKPLAVTMAAATVDAAVRGSLSKLQSALETIFGRLSSTRRRVSQAASPRVLIPDAGTKRIKREAPKKTVAKKPVRKETATTGREPKKKGIHLARRKSWPRVRTSGAGA